MIRESRMVVVPAHRDSLEKFRKAELVAYAKRLGLGDMKTKDQAITALVLSDRATMCASLGD